MTTVSVCMAVKNGEDTIRSSIGSIVWQTFVDWELIVIDDASDDATREIVESFADKRIRLVCNAENIGPAACRNKAISLSAGKYIAVMDADDLSFPDRFSKQVKFLEAKPDVDLVGGQALMFRDDWYPIGVMDVPLEHVDIAAHPFSFIPLHNPCLMGRKEWFSKYGYSEEYLKAEDYEMLLRALRFSRYANLPDILLGYRYEVNNLKKRIATRRYVWLAVEHNCLNSRRQCWNAKLRQLAKGFLDVIVYKFGLVGLLDARRLKIPSSKIIADWSKLIVLLK